MLLLFGVILLKFIPALFPDKLLINNVGEIEIDLQTYEVIEGNSRRIRVYYTLSDATMASTKGEAIGRECLRVMFAWLKHKGLKIPDSRGSLYCFILYDSGITINSSEYWLVILDEKTKEVVTVKRH